MAPEFSNGKKQIIMDTKIIKQYGEDILCYRLRTARQKKRMQHKDFEKHLIQLDKEQGALYQKRKNLGWEPLISPVQKGWKRFFVLRDDVARSNQAAFFQGIPDKINTYDWSHRKNFLVRRRRQGKKVYVVKNQKLKEPRPDDFIKMGFSETERYFFNVEWRLDWGVSHRIHLVFNEPWKFVLKVKPNMITKVRERDEVMEARIKEIDNYLERNDYEGMLARLKHGSYRYKEWKNFGRYDEVNPFMNWPFERILDRLEEEKINK
jgi:hypothetical protein